MNLPTGVLLVNLGTPLSPRLKDVYHYLIEFLTDGRVIDKPWALRQLLVRGLIIPARRKSSTKAYRTIWTSDGSPLLIYGQKVKNKLQAHLGQKLSRGVGHALPAAYNSRRIAKFTRCRAPDYLAAFSPIRVSHNRLSTSTRDGIDQRSNHFAAPNFCGQICYPSRLNAGAFKAVAEPFKKVRPCPV